MKTTPKYGLRYPERGDTDDLSTQLHNLGDDVGAAMNALLPDSGVVANGIAVSPASGWSLLATTHRTIGVKMFVLLQFTRTGAAITADATGGSNPGNIADSIAGTITDTTRRPSINWDGLYRAGTTSGSVTIDTGGVITLRDAHAGSSISTGDVINIYAPYTIPVQVAGILLATDHGIYFPADTDRPIGDNDVTHIALTAESIDAALSALVPDTGTVNTGVPVTPASGWEVLLAEYRAIGKDMYLHVWLKRTGAAITADSAGNVAGDPDLFTITDPALQPSFTPAPVQFRASFTGGACQMKVGGLCSMYDMHSGSSIKAPTSESYHTLQVFVNYPIP